MEYIKALCEHCDGAIEFPVDGIGETINCPHCQEEIVLENPNATREELETFIQRNSKYYLDNPRNFSLTIGIFFPYWICYRKMYWLAAIIWGAFILLAFIAPAGLVDFLSFLGVIYFGFSGKSNYLNHAEATVIKIKNNVTQDMQLKEIRAKGGTNGWLTGLLIMMMLGLIIFLKLSPQ
jgi:hypothetical protein